MRNEGGQSKEAREKASEVKYTIIDFWKIDTLESLQSTDLDRRVKASIDPESSGNAILNIHETTNCRWSSREGLAIMEILSCWAPFADQCEHPQRGMFTRFDITITPMSLEIKYDEQPIGTDYPLVKKAYKFDNLDIAISIVTAPPNSPQST